MSSSSNTTPLFVKIERIIGNDDLPLPSYATSHAAGLDLLAAIEENVHIHPGATAIIPTGIKIALPEGYEAQVRPRSGLAAKNSVTVLNTPGTIDADYRGEIKVILINLSREDFIVTRGMRIAQLVINQYTTIRWDQVETLEIDTDRGEGGLGSTGLKQKHLIN